MVRKFLAARVNFILIIIATILVVQGCSGSSQQAQSFTVSGSSTVYPISLQTATAFQAANPTEPPITLQLSGTTDGFAAFCQGEIAIANASRPINRSEMKACQDNKVAYMELPIAFDALTVVVNKNNNWMDSITVEQLRQIWEPSAEGVILKWNQLDPAWPDERLALFGPGEESGTFDYFTEAIIGESGASRRDYVQSADDENTFRGVTQNLYALGYYGLAYYNEHQGEIKALAIESDAERGPVFPSVEAVENADYQPLARPLFIYVNAQTAQNNPLVEKFVEFYLKNAATIVSQVGYVPLPEDGYRLTQLHFERGKVGTVFDGQAVFNLTIEELLRKQAVYLEQQ